MVDDEDFHLRIKHNYWILLIEFSCRPLYQRGLYSCGTRFESTDLSFNWMHYLV